MTHASPKKYLPLFGEFVAALAMLAILILTFAPVTPANSILSSASASDTVNIETSWCGDPLSGDQTGHAGACHACRFDMGGLPDPSCASEPAFASLGTANLIPGRTVLLPVEPVLAHGTRAPPHSV